MPSTSQKQHNFMEALAHSRKFAKKAGVPQSVGKDFAAADEAAGKYAHGGIPGKGMTRGGMPNEPNRVEHPGRFARGGEAIPSDEAAVDRRGGLSEAEIKEHPSDSASGHVTCPACGHGFAYGGEVDGFANGVVDEDAHAIDVDSDDDDDSTEESEQHGLAQELLRRHRR